MPANDGTTRDWLPEPYMVVDAWLCNELSDHRPVEIYVDYKRIRISLPIISAPQDLEPGSRVSILVRPDGLSIARREAGP